MVAQGNKVQYRQRAFAYEIKSHFLLLTNHPAITSLVHHLPSIWVFRYFFPIPWAFCPSSFLSYHPPPSRSQTVYPRRLIRVLWLYNDKASVSFLITFTNQPSTKTFAKIWWILDLDEPFFQNLAHTHTPVGLAALLPISGVLGPGFGS